MERCYKEIFRSIFTKNTSAKMIPDNESLYSFIECYQLQLSDCTQILNFLNQGLDIDNDLIIAITSKPTMKLIMTKFPNIYSFKKITTNYLTSKANTIISYCSVMSSILSKIGQSRQDLEQTANAIQDSIISYMKLSHTNTNITICKFQNYEIDPDLSIYLDKEKLLENNQKISKEIEQKKFSSHVCCLCNEYPAISYVTPCNHSFLCMNCLQEAFSSNNIWKCYICGKKIEEVKKLSPSK